MCLIVDVAVNSSGLDLLKIVFHNVSLLTSHRQRKTCIHHATWVYFVDVRWLGRYSMHSFTVDLLTVIWHWLRYWEVLAWVFVSQWLVNHLSVIRCSKDHLIPVYVNWWQLNVIIGLLVNLGVLTFLIEVSSAVNSLLHRYSTLIFISDDLRKKLLLLFDLLATRGEVCISTHSARTPTYLLIFRTLCLLVLLHISAYLTFILNIFHHYFIFLYLFDLILQILNHFLLLWLHLLLLLLLL